MRKRYEEWEKAVLGALLDQYERSRTYEGKNQRTQRFSISPTKVFPEYESDFADIDLIHDFERQMRELEQEGLLTVSWNSQVIEKLTANPESWADYYQILGRKEKRERIREQRELYLGYLGFHESLDHFCREQLLRLEKGKNAEFPAAEAAQILRLWKFLLENQEELLERELSIAILGDSKAWEKSYRSRVCRLLNRYGDFDELLTGVDDEKEAFRILLEECHVSANPSYVYCKGDAELTFTDGQILRLRLDMPVAFTEKTFQAMRRIHILADRVMTVENLTSYNRLEKEGFFYVFLSGYHSRVKQSLLTRIREDNRPLEWFHFGDIDPDGFYIIEHLKRGTGLPFQPIYMGVPFLKNYDAYTKPLEKNDIAKAKTLLEQRKYSEVMEYMLREGKKLEQEIINGI